MVESEPLVAPIKADTKDFDAGTDKVERRMKDLEKKAKDGGNKMSAFIGGAIGGAFGSIVGDVVTSGPIGTIFELLTNMILVAIMPLLMALLPLLEKAAGIAKDAAGDVATFLTGGKGGVDNYARGGAVTGAVAGGLAFGLPGAAIGGVAGGAAGVYRYGMQDNGDNSPFTFRGANGQDIRDDDTTFYFLGPVKVPAKRSNLYGTTVVG